jgi:hypothetical protein
LSRSIRGRCTPVHLVVAVVAASAAHATAAAFFVARTLPRRTLTTTVAALEWFELDDAQASRCILADVYGGGEDARIVGVEVGRSERGRVRNVRRGKGKEMLDRLNPRREGEMIRAVKAGLAMRTARTVMMLSSGTGGDAVSRTTWTLASLSAGARANHHVLARGESERRINIHLHRLDFDPAILSHGIKALDPRQTER